MNDSYKEVFKIISEGIDKTGTLIVNKKHFGLPEGQEKGRLLR